MCANTRQSTNRISGADIIDILDRYLGKPKFFTSHSHARAVPKDAKIWNYAWVDNNTVTELLYPTEVDITLIRVAPELLSDDLMDRVEDTMTPELAHSPRKSVESPHGEGPSSSQDEDTANEGKEMEHRAQEESESNDDQEPVKENTNKEDGRKKKQHTVMQLRHP